MPDAVYVDEAARWARFLTQTESRGPGDLENAWSRLERRYGVPARMRTAAAAIRARATSRLHARASRN
jgi:hypothetical protein